MTGWPEWDIRSWCWHPDLPVVQCYKVTMNAHHHKSVPVLLHWISDVAKMQKSNNQPTELPQMSCLAILYCATYKIHNVLLYDWHMHQYLHRGRDCHCKLSKIINSVVPISGGIYYESAFELRFPKYWTSRGVRMSRVPASRAGRSKNPKISGSIPKPAGSNPGRVKPMTFKLILVAS